MSQKRIEFDTSKEALEEIGIYLSDEQYDDLCTINKFFMATEENNMPVYHILLILKTLGLLPAKESPNKGKQSDSGEREFLKVFQEKFGKIKD